MFEVTNLINKSSSLVNELKQDHIFFNNCLLGEQKSEFIISEVKKIIKIHGLDNKTRKRDAVHKRYFIYFFLSRNLKLTLTDIGMLFKKDHSSVVHGIQKHELFTEANDFIYIDDTLDIRKTFDNNAFEKFITDKMENKLFNDTGKFKDNQICNIRELENTLNQLKELYQE